jgi:hypothetical protein
VHFQTYLPFRPDTQPSLPEKHFVAALLEARGGADGGGRMRRAARCAPSADAEALQGARGVRDAEPGAVGTAGEPSGPSPPTSPATGMVSDWRSGLSKTMHSKVGNASVCVRVQSGPHPKCGGSD